MRSWNIETDFIEKVSCPDKLTATIRESYIYIYSASAENKATIFYWQLIQNVTS